MSLQILKRPNQHIIPAYGGETIFTVAETSFANFGQDNFKFLFEVRVFFTDETGGVQNQYHRFSVKPRVTSGWSIASFDISQVVQDYCTTDTEIFTGSNSGSYDGTAADIFPTTRFSIHTVDKFSRQRSNMIKVVVSVYEYYTVNGVDTFDAYTTLGQKYAFFNGTQQYDEGATAFDDAKYIVNTSSSEFLSSFGHGVERKLRLGDYHTLAFTNGKFFNSLGTANASQLEQIQFKFYDSSNSLLSTQVVGNSTANGGYPSGSVEIGANNVQLQGTLLYAGVGCKNITNAGMTIPANTAYYEVTGLNSLSAACTRTYTFRVQDDDCKGYETIRLAYLNRLGGWDYYNFTKKSTRTVNTTQGLMKENQVSYGNTYAYRQSWRGGAKAYRTNSTEIIEANTDFITEDEANVLEELFTSPQVFMQDTTNTIDTFLPVVVTEKSYTKQTTANDGLKQYVISIEKSNEKVIQRL